MSAARERTMSVSSALNDSQHPLPYVTLSHRWGGANIFKLTKHTYNALLKGILVRSLPKTFREAVQVTRALGAGFLWIDSLCIFQDSPDDWREQGGIMGYIYLNGWCNIAA